MKNAQRNSSFLAVFDRKPVHPAPIWLMRQAGRYLPEYQATRKKAGSFWTMCMTPELAVEVTLQPIQRFDFDAAILFSDILVVPHALGQGVRFEDGHGPVLDAFGGVDRLVQDRNVWEDKLAPVYAAMRQTRVALADNKALIGFAGAPWTLAAYMLEGKGSPDQRAVKLGAYRDPIGFAKLLNVLADTVAWHLIRQLEVGADAVQLFDSWAGGLPEAEFADWVIAPNARVVAAVRKAIPNAKIIGFPRGVGAGLLRYVEDVPLDAVGLDWAVGLDFARDRILSRIPAGRMGTPEEVARAVLFLAGEPFVTGQILAVDGGRSLAP